MSGVPEVAREASALSWDLGVAVATYPVTEASQKAMGVRERPLFLPPTPPSLSHVAPRSCDLLTVAQHLSQRPRTPLARATQHLQASPAPPYLQVALARAPRASLLVTPSRPLSLPPLGAFQALQKVALSPASLLAT